MKHAFISLAALLLTVTPQLHAQSLKKTVHHFIKVVSDTKISEQQYTSKLKPYIDPDSNTDSLCADYYQYWKHSADLGNYPLKTKIEKVELITTTSAEVIISNVWHSATEGNFRYVSK